MFDNAIKENWYITDNEYDRLCELFTDEELDLFINESPTFSQKRQLLKIVDKYIDLQDYRNDQLDRLL